jgi:hypothetical protein
VVVWRVSTRRGERRSDDGEEEDEETYILMWDSTPTSCAPARKVRVV